MNFFQASGILEVKLISSFLPSQKNINYQGKLISNFLIFYMKTLKPQKIISLQFSVPIPSGEESLFRPKFIASHNSRSSVTSNISCDFFTLKT